mmetsp:Transcript_1436/g.3248  ORF Transcript_1436/g.3248 Transcript_1436/m.3248 type:complete len:279 (+) Transcript_1436:143-979(+)
MEHGGVNLSRRPGCRDRAVDEPEVLFAAGIHSEICRRTRLAIVVSWGKADGTISPSSTAQVEVDIVLTEDGHTQDDLRTHRCHHCAHVHEQELALHLVPILVNTHGIHKRAGSAGIHHLTRRICLCKTSKSEHLADISLGRQGKLSITNLEAKGRKHAQVGAVFPHSSDVLEDAVVGCSVQSHKSGASIHDRSTTVSTSDRIETAVSFVFERGARHMDAPRKLTPHMRCHYSRPSLRKYVVPNKISRRAHFATKTSREGADLELWQKFRLACFGRQSS